MPQNVKLTQHSRKVCIFESGSGFSGLVCRRLKLWISRYRHRLGVDLIGRSVGISTHSVRFGIAVVSISLIAFLVVLFYGNVIYPLPARFGIIEQLFRLNVFSVKFDGFFERRNSFTVLPPI